MKETLKFSLVLFLICFISALFLSFVNKFTQPKILAQLEKEEKTNLKDLIPQAQIFEPIKKKDEIHYYKAFDKNKKLLGFVFKAEAKGYSSKILTLAAINPEGKIIAIKILSHNETPGIGAKITEVKTTQTLWDRIKGKTAEEERPWFPEQFKGKDISNLDREVQAITQATISSEAVIKSVKEKGQSILKEVRDAR